MCEFRIINRTALIPALALSAIALTGLASAPAQASTGEAVIYTGDQTPLTVYQNPTGCRNFTTGARPPTTTLLNLTDGPVYYYGQRNCPVGGEVLVVQPGYGRVLPINSYVYYSLEFT
ncbi:hypothetical protein ABZZ79_03630 [Streptomyces sp. NPDC006458]|uniref:hypothetical protein n=1 Tax=Streptomyces sp. NPDC006458 TaxID=3154302 RepID=UPI0033A625C1